jgi:hypothetical protein
MQTNARFWDMRAGNAAGYSSQLIRNYDQFDSAVLERYSPVHHAAEIAVPVLIVDYGDSLLSQSLENALACGEHKVRFVEYEEDRDDASEGRAERLALEFRSIAEFLSAQIGQ